MWGGGFNQLFTGLIRNLLEQPVYMYKPYASVSIVELIIIDWEKKNNNNNNKKKKKNCGLVICITQWKTRKKDKSKHTHAVHYIHNWRRYRYKPDFDRDEKHINESK